MKNKKVWAIVALIVAIGIMFGIYKMNQPKVTETVPGKSVIVEVVNSKKDKAIYDFKTDEKYLIGAMDQLSATTDFSYQAEDSEYGAFITTVNGEEAKTEDSAYWAIYVNGEYGQYGASEQPVKDGDRFTLAYEKY